MVSDIWLVIRTDKTFSGVIYYHDMDGEFVNGWK